MPSFVLNFKLFMPLPNNCFEIFYEINKPKQKPV